ncbi:amidase [Streptomyces sp. CBMA152]|uniref:amidase n=1 Tax=Streptomyces sp. CBMA152 TaxID=1896312 RepID=UPI00166165B3|nr:amidase [Streptomyces sp. CBMA152]MBD0747483.1 amidase [Streptomyces sp. CBMA152]
MTEPTTGTAALADLTARQLLDGYGKGDFTPVEATSAVLDRIEAVQPRINAFVRVDAEQALAQAEAATERRRKGEPLGLLDGVPVSVKDTLPMAGGPTLRGSKGASTKGSWDVDASAVARLREQGAVFVGKTTTPEFGWKATTDSALSGITHNPHDPDRTAGGSSGGSAAAVAAGAAPLSLGTDGGGSIRIPASFCGVVGLKPTYGRVPLFPASPFGSLAHVGPLARSAADAALLLDVICGADWRDWSVRPAEPVSPLLAEGVKGLRIAYSPHLGGQVAVRPVVAAAVRAAVARLAGLGAYVEEADPDFADPVAAFHTLWFTGAARVAHQLPSAWRASLEPGLREIAEQGAHIGAVDYLAATEVQAQLSHRMARFHRTYDLLVTPTLPITAFEAGVEVPRGSGLRRWTGWTPFTYPFNMTGQPAVTVPVGTDSAGLPIGLQLVAARHRDDLVLRAAHALEQ